MEPVRIDVWSDVACPWCWVGKRHLEKALSGVTDADVVWRAFELNPRAPVRVDGGSVDREGVESKDGGPTYAQRLARKYGVSEEEGQAMIDRMKGIGESAGLDFRFDRIKPTNTFDAHRLLRWAADEGRQPALKERLFQAYMHEGLLLGDPDVLAEQAASVGLDGGEAKRILADGRFADEVRTDEVFARQIGVSGVPFYVFGGRLSVSGAQPSEVLRGAYDQVLEERACPTTND